LDKLFERNPHWIKNTVQATENRDLVNAIRTLLPAELADRARSATLEQSVLVVTAEAAVWCGRLRYEIIAMLPELQKQWPHLQTVKLRLAPARPPA
jgi:hypothetical protein